MACPNVKECICPKTTCPNHGKCCACVIKHRGLIVCLIACSRITAVIRATKIIIAYLKNALKKSNNNNLIGGIYYGIVWFW